MNGHTMKRVKFHPEFNSCERSQVVSLPVVGCWICVGPLTRILISETLHDIMVGIHWRSDDQRNSFHTSHPPALETCRCAFLPHRSGFGHPLPGMVRARSRGVSGQADRADGDRVHRFCLGVFVHHLPQVSLPAPVANGRPEGFLFLDKLVPDLHRMPQMPILSGRTRKGRIG